MPYKLGKKWMAQTTIDGQKVRKRFDTKTEAKAWEVEQKDRIQHPEKQIHSVSLLEWGTGYLEFALRKYSPKVVNEKTNVFRIFVKRFGADTFVSKLTPGMILSYCQKEWKKRSGHSVNKDLKNLQAAYNWGIKYHDFSEPNPFVKVDRLPQDQHVRYVPPEKDFWAVYNVAKGQDRVLLHAFLFTAARRGEVYKLRWADVDFEGRLIRLGTRKRKNGSLEFEQIPMLDELSEALQEYREESEGLWVFSQPTGRRKGQPYTENRGFPQDLCRQAGVKPFGCHAIRHLSASILAQNNVPMIAIQQILRHKKLSTTERYVRGLEPVRVHLQVLSGGFLKNKPTTEPTKEKGLKAV